MNKNKIEQLRKEARDWLAKTGHTKIAFRCGIESDAVKRWPINSIPEMHWVTLFSIEPGLRVETLHKWNEAIRAAKGQK